MVAQEGGHGVVTSSFRHYQRSAPLAVGANRPVDVGTDLDQAVAVDHRVVPLDDDPLLGRREGEQQQWTFKHVPSEIGAMESEEVG